MAVYGSAASILLRRRHVITMHGNQTMTEVRRRRVALRLAFRVSHATVAVSEDTRQHLLKSLSLPPSRVCTIPNGVPATIGNPEGPRKEFGISSDEVVFVAAGNLRPRKGHMILLRALAKLTKEGCATPWRLIIAGEGDERPNLESFLAESGLTDRVHLPGHRLDVYDLQAAGHVTVMPSLWEGLPLAILEGMHSGNAIVASRTSGIPEAVRDELDGLLTPPGDVDALAAALRRLLEDRTLIQRLAASAQERARSRYSIERMMDDYEALYFD
jgi:glycosyltransferase involved in cell wall biosynthesis